MIEFKRHGVGLLLSALTMTAQTGNANPSVTIDDVSGMPGENVVVGFQFTNALQDAVAFDGIISFDSTNLTVIGFNCPDPRLTCNSPAPGDFRWIANDLMLQPLPDLQFALTLRISPMAVPQSVFDLIFESENYFDAAGQPIQAGASMEGSVTVTQPCQYQVDPTDFVFDASGGGGQYNVDTTSGCSWDATSGDPWIIADTSGGTGPGMGGFTVQPNGTASDRMGTLTVAGVQLQVTQEGSGCTYMVTPTNFTFGAEGGNASYSVDTQMGCPWTVNTDDGWIVPTTTNGTGPGMGSFAVSPNATGGSRMGLLTVAGVDLSITQAAPEACGYTVTPAMLTVGAEGGIQSLTVNTSPSCAWTLESNQPWLVISPANRTGQGTATRSFNVMENDSSASRTGVIGVVESATPASITVTQQGLSSAVAVGDSFSMKEDATLFGDVTLNDTLGADFREVAPAMPPSNGMLRLNPNGSFEYRPRPDFSGEDRFAYRLVSTSGAASTAATVVIAVDAAPDPLGDFFDTREGNTVNANVTANDDLGSGLGQVLLRQPPPRGVLDLQADGRFTYTPSGPGPVVFTYSLVDVDGDASRPTQVNINVTPNPALASRVEINPNGDFASQINDAIAMANTSGNLIRVSIPAGSYQYPSGTGRVADTITGRIAFEAVNGTATISGNGQNGGGWLFIDGGVVELRGLVVQAFGEIDGGAIHVANGGALTVVDSTLQDNFASSRGGALLVSDLSEARLMNSSLRNNTSVSGGGAFIESGARFTQRGGELFGNEAEEGGALAMSDVNASCLGSNACALFVQVINVNVEANSADSGGAFLLGLITGDDGDRVLIESSVLSDNTASESGCDLQIDNPHEPVEPGAVVLRDATLFGDCAVGRIEGGAGGITIIDSTLVHDGIGIRFEGTVRLEGTILTDSSLVSGKSLAGAKSACESQAGEFESLGFNISSDESCGLDDSTDQSSTDPMLQRSGKDFSVLSGSPILDNGPSEMISLVSGEGKKLPCGYKDVNGLGRPQDGDEDGTYECDIGNVESKSANAPDVSGATTSAYFDPTRPGEGVFVELLDGGLAFVAMFTYASDASGPVWMVGVGNASSNSVVVDEMLLTTGGSFGAGFDAEAISLTAMGGMSLVYSDCEASEKPGKLAFQAAVGTPFTDLLVDAARLSTVVSCDPETVNAKAGRSGSFFEPSRSGEGIFVQWLDDGRVLVIWYTYDPDGNQFWTISGDVEIDEAENKVTASMLYPAQGSVFGLDFDPADVVLEDWGTLTLDYSDCDNLTLSYESSVSGFGGGSFEYQRLTSIADTVCDL